MTSLAARFLIALLAIATSSAHSADAYLGPLAVRLGEPAADGKSNPVKHVPVWLNARVADTNAEGIATFDGVPSGRHTLKVRLPGYAAVTQTLDLGAGVRRPVEISLRPEPGADLLGHVADRVSGRPVAGATVRLRPLAVQAAVQGPGQAVSNWDGAFEFVDLAPGRYALSVSAPGFDTLTREFQAHTRAENSREFVDPTLDGVALDVCLQSGADCGKPAADAFCRKQGWGAALEHRIRNDAPPTRIIGSGTVCSEKHCDRIEWLRCAALSEVDDLRLNPVAANASLNLSLIDTVSQRPVAGARVTLAETWPSGEIAQGKTNAAGLVAFTNLKTGLANWANSDNKVALARRRITARVEVDGYAPAVFPVSLNETATLRLNPTTLQAEQEPNDLNAPQDVLVGAPIRYAIQRNGDRDVFRFRLAEPAKVVILAGPNNPLETHVRIRDSEARLLREQGNYGGQENRQELWLGAGAYLVEIGEWGDNASAADKPMTLLIEATPATDPSEPNENTGQATPLRLTEQAAGLIWPVGDRDHYRIDVARPGQLRVRMPAMGMERHVRILNSDGNMLQEQGVYGGNPLDFTHQVAPGVYFVDVMEWGNNSASLTPYRLLLDLLPDDGIDDPPLGQGSPRAVRELAPGTSVHATLLPRGDIDLYSVAIPSAGTLNIRNEGRLERHVQLYDRQGRQLTEQGVYGNNPSHIAWEFAGPDTAYVSLREWGDNNDSASAYRLSAWFDPADEVDALQRNDDFDHATPIASGATVRGSYMPRADRDIYVIETDHPGYLRVKSRAGLETHLRVFDSQRRQMTEQGVYGSNPAELAPAVAAGTYYVMIGEWGDNASGAVPYELSATLERAEPGEAWPMQTDPPRRLKNGEARSYSIDHNGDLDRFLFDLAGPGKVTVSVASPVETLIRIYDDQTNALLHESGHYAATYVSHPFEFKHPVRLRIELREWGDNAASLTSGFVMADTQGRSLSAARIEAQAVADNPLRVSFRAKNLDRGDAMQRCDLDLNRDGRIDLTLNGDQPAEYRFAETGRYDIEALCQGPAGQTSRQRFFTQVSLPEEKRGIALFVPSPAPGQSLTEAIDLKAHAMSYDGKRIGRVEFRLDGRLLSSDYEAPYEYSPDWQALAAGEHALTVVAYDTAGVKAELTRKFSLSEFFGLTPPDGAVLSGDRARVSWTGASFGTAKVRYRNQVNENWHEAVGESGRQRSVVLADLVAGVPYQFQPIGITEGPVRTLTRVKGLAFSQPRYGANIKRDYDQKVAIGLRNNGDKPLKVRLECGKPSDPLLLAGFVGEGSEDTPIDLGPGESRQFLLGLSAQDVIRAEHRVPVRIVADNGLADEAEVAVTVQLPRVELVWEDKGPAADGVGHVYRLINKGDNLTDLEVTAADPGKVTILPTVRHGLLQANQHQDFTVAPQFHEGFTGVTTKLIARAIDTRVEQDYAMRLGPGESARRIWLFPGQDSGAMTPIEEQEAIRTAEAAGRLSPDAVNWKLRDNPEDTDQDGRMDRWSQRLGDTLWVGDDSDNDGEIDFVHADVGDDGAFEYSAWLENGRWRPTNLVEAWLEMGFALPWSRDSYKAHDAEVVLNDVVIGRMKDVIPEGNFAFRIPPRALKFDDSGKPGDNQVGIRSQHLRGGHYVVNSDFRFKFRLTATPVWTVATSAEEARAKVLKQSNLTASAADFSLSATEMRLIGPASPKAGDDLKVEFAVRNLGANSPAGVPIALSRSLSNGAREELARIEPAQIALTGLTRLSIPFKARAGANTLTVSIDPDQAFPDLDRSNNTGSLFVQVAGDAKPPTLTLSSPVDGQTLADALVRLEASAQDDEGIAGLFLAIDGGLWQDLKAVEGVAKRELLLQPGEHRLNLRAVDYSDNRVETAATVRVAATAPTVRLLAPADGARIDARSVEVIAELPADAALVAARTAGGPWRRGQPRDGQARIDVPLNFGAQDIELLVADRNGVAATLRRRVECTRQPGEGETSLATIGEGLVWPADRPGFAIDLFKGLNGVLEATDEQVRTFEPPILAVTPPAPAGRDYTGAKPGGRDFTAPALAPPEAPQREAEPIVEQPAAILPIAVAPEPAPAPLPILPPEPAPILVPPAAPLPMEPEPQAAAPAPTPEASPQKAPKKKKRSKWDELRDAVKSLKEILKD